MCSLLISPLHDAYPVRCAADAKYRLLHISVAVAFAEQLQQDLQALKEKRLGNVSLAGKWAPTPGSKC